MSNEWKPLKRIEGLEGLNPLPIPPFDSESKYANEHGLKIENVMTVITDGLNLLIAEQQMS